ncbi:MAG: pyridoxal phosphate-dependent aminotransferase family protein [Thaumarchaeota archaeon]|nr:pyridoxal phosphate-dependent aminotransferase family protein [Nitrososphaerota archaeon]
MKSKLNYILPQLEKIKKENLYRQLRFGYVERAFIIINKKKLLNLCSNDYLGMPTTKLPLKQMQSSSRLVSGNDASFEILEKKLAKHKSQQGALIFSSGYMANLGSITTIIKKNDLILSDEFNHASIIESCKLAGARVLVYKHNNIDELNSKLKQKNKRKFIITEGIFSMDGDFANLKQITETAEKKNAITILDDAHGDFTVGQDGKGSANHFGVSKKIDLYISSLSKGLGSFGGYITSQKELIDLCINKSKSFIYTSALPSTLVEYSLNRFNSDREKYRKKLDTNIHHLSSGLKKLGYEINSQTHIIPIIIGKEKTTLDFGRYLFERGIYSQPIRFPTVPKNKARIRISITSWFSKNQIEKILDVFDSAGQRFKMF